LLQSTTDIYEQVSYLRSSVEEVNRLVGEKHTECDKIPVSVERKDSANIPSVLVTDLDDITDQGIN
jgi:hypothetical protein